MEFPVYGMKVVRSYGELPPVEGHSYILIEDAFEYGKLHARGPVQDNFMDTEWFKQRELRRLLAEDTEWHYMNYGTDASWDRLQNLIDNNHRRQQRQGGKDNA